jgi:acetyl-CoA C-acetyltransferase
MPSGLEPEALVVGMGCFEGGIFVPARQIALKAGLPVQLPSVTLDRACCSGMSAIGQAWKEIRGGLRSVVSVVGVESLSRTPYLLPEIRWGVRRGDIKLGDPLAFRSPVAGDVQIAKYTGEVALSYGFGRDAQDEWAVTSHERYGAALRAGRLAGQVLRWSEVVRGDTDDGHADEQYRPQVSIHELAKLDPVYGSPTVTAGNAPGLNDGAAAVTVVAGSADSDPPPDGAAYVVDYVELAGEVTAAAVMPGEAIVEILRRNQLSVSDIGAFEINEAYAATVLCSTLAIAQGDKKYACEIACKTNMWGGAIATGHPLGASGVRISINLIDVLGQQGGGYGIAAVCGGFGQTDALLIKVV